MIRFLFIALIAVACSAKENTATVTKSSAETLARAEVEKSDETTEPLPPLPTDAKQEKFADTPNLVKVTSLQGEGLYHAGKREGTWIEYHSNGALKTITTYVDGKKEGLAVELNQNGQLVRKWYHHADLKHGEYREYNYSNVREECFYQNDKLEGLVKIFYENGKPMEEGNYKNGTRHGVSKWYDQNGNLSISYEYDNGVLVKK